MGKTNIEWATHTWNPYRWNCTPISPGCKHCYAHERATRFPQAANGGSFLNPIARRGAPSQKELKTFPAGSVIFVNSMSDTYHETAPLRYIHSIHNTALLKPHLTFLVLTKRPERVYGLRHQLAWPENLWLGTSVENADYIWRLDYLLRTPAAGHFLSAEPLLGSLVYGHKTLKPYLHSMPGRAVLKWVIVGGESGKYRRPLNVNWVREIRDLCVAADVPFMYKQGSAFKSGQDRLLDGRTWDETPFAQPEPETNPHQMELF